MRTSVWIATFLFIFFLAGTVSVQAASSSGFWTRFSAPDWSTWQEKVSDWYVRWVPGDKPGSLVLNKAWRNTRQLTSARMTGRVEAELWGEEHRLSQGQLQLSGPVLFNEWQTNAQPNQDWSITADVSDEGTQLKADIDFKRFNAQRYVRFNTVPSIRWGEWSLADWHRWQGQWFALADNQPLSIFENRPPLSSELVHQLIGRAHLSSAQAAIEDGKSVYVVMVTLPKSQVLAWWQATANQLDSEPVVIAHQLETLDRWLGAEKDVVVAVVIDRKQLVVRSVSLPLTLTVSEIEDSPETAVLLSQMPEDAANAIRAQLALASRLRLTLSLSMAAANQPVVVTEPSEVLPFGELIGQRVSVPASVSAMPVASDSAKRLQDFNLEVESF